MLAQEPQAGYGWRLRRLLYDLEAPLGDSGKGVFLQAGEPAADGEHVYPVERIDARNDLGGYRRLKYEPARPRGTHPPFLRERRCLEVEFRQRISLVGEGDEDPAEVRPVLQIQLNNDPIPHHILPWSPVVVHSPFSLVMRPYPDI